MSDNPMSSPMFDHTPGRLGDVAKLMPLIVVDRVDERRFYTVDGGYLGTYQPVRPWAENQEVAKEVLQILERPEYKVGSLVIKYVRRIFGNHNWLAAGESENCDE